MESNYTVVLHSIVSQITLEFYDPNSSSMSSKILCSDNRCSYALETGAAVCNPSDSRSNQCVYTNTYVDGSATSGYYVSHTLHFDAFMRNEQGVSSSASVFFGYSFLAFCTFLNFQSDNCPY